MDAFYIPDGDRFVSTGWTRGPWSKDHQHAGPPAALTARAIEKLAPDMRVARVTFEILRPIPIAPLTATARIERPGKRVTWARAELAAGGEVVAEASAWLFRPAADSQVASGLEAPPLPPPDRCPPAAPFDVGEEQSYFHGIEWRDATRTLPTLGPAAVWMRLRHPLVAGEDTSPLGRVLTVADSGNGISNVVDIRTHLFVNVELSVHLVREPAGEWVCVDAITRVDGSGRGLAQSVLWDERSRLGAGAQSLLIAAR